MKKSILALVILMMFANFLLISSYAEEETETAAYGEENANAVTEQMMSYISSLGGYHATPYYKAGRAVAWGCCAFVNEVWQSVLGQDTYDLVPEAVESSGAVSDVYSFLEDNDAKSGDILWAHGSGLTHYVIVHDWDENGMWISDGGMSGIVLHNNEYVDYDYYNGFFSGSCALTLYRLPNVLYQEISGDLPEDVEADKWYANAVSTVIDNGFMGFTGETSFLPDEEATRAQLIQALYKLEGSPDTEDTEDSFFVDVDEEKWYAEAVSWAASNNIVSGTSEELFEPKTSLTRQEMAAIIYKYIKYKDLDDNASVLLDSFLDSSDVASWAVKPLQWAVANGLIKGVDNQLLSQEPATRAQVAQVIVGLQNLIASQTE